MPPSILAGRNDDGNGAGDDGRGLAQPEGPFLSLGRWFDVGPSLQEDRNSSRASAEINRDGAPWLSTGQVASPAPRGASAANAFPPKACFFS